MRLFLITGMILVAGIGMAFAQETIVIENENLRWELAPDGQNLHFVDKKSGQDFLHVKTPSYALAFKGVHPDKIAFENGRLVAERGQTKAVIRVEIEKNHFSFEILSISGPAPDELAFLNVPLALKGKPEEPFAACALALNLKTNVTEIPGPMNRLHASCYPKFGIEGANVAVIACPQEQLRDVMKEVVSRAEDLPKTNIGGPWALDAEINRGSYVFDFGTLTESSVDAWAEFAKSLGINQIDFHTGKSLRFGDCVPDPILYPKGRASVKAVIDKLHAAGISAGLHTYSFFIAKNARYVSPVPDPRLGKDATFTLAEPLAIDAAAVPVVEPTTDMSTVTSFFVHNSVTLQIDNELITYADIDKSPPYQFTKCQRGACGTKAVAHDKGAKVYHLKECFGLFTPDADSTLLSEVAANTAEAYNECGFDMIYLDALDGEAILAGADNAWHYGSKFVFEIARRLKKPALFEMSTFHHHLWYVRARMGAWDTPTRWQKQFVDLHCAANNDGRGMFLPMNLGWWTVQVWSDASATLTEPTYPDIIEYLMGKCIGYNMGVSLMGVDPGSIQSVPAYQRLAPIFRQYEDLRHAHYFPESVLAKLRVPGDEYTLEKAGEGKWQFRSVQYAKHKVQGIDGWSNAWVNKNKFGAQPTKMRIEALMAAASYDSPDAMAIEDFSKPEAFTDRANETGVSASLDSSPAQVKVGDASGHFAATSDRANPNGAWARIARTFTPPLDFGARQALGVWVHGDGQGELLNLQVRSPENTSALGMGDHYAEINFNGWRYFELVEVEGGHIRDFSWPYNNSSYAIFREAINYAQVGTLGLWFNNLPQGKKAECYLSPIKVLPLLKTKLINPKVKIGGTVITFPTEIETGSYLEFNAMDDCKLYGPTGGLVAEVKPEGTVPSLAPGDNPVEFNCEAPEGVSARAKVTVISQGEPIS